MAPEKPHAMRRTPKVMTCRQPIMAPKSSATNASLHRLRVKMRLFISAAILFSIATSSSVSASEVLRFRIGTACDGVADACGPRIFAEGPIDENAATRFASFFALNSSSLPHKKQISLHSPGGNVLAAIQLGTLIRRLGLDTELVDGQTCASACSLVFMGGVERSFWTGSRLGVHQFSSGGLIDEGGAQQLSTAISTYAANLGIDRRVMDIASLVPPRSMYWLTATELKQLRVDNSDAALSDWTLGVDDYGDVIASAVLRLPGDRVTAVYSVRLVEGQPHLQVTVQALPSERQRFAQAFSAHQMEVAVSIDNPKAAPIHLDPLVWFRGEDRVTSSVPLPTSIVDAASNASTVQIYFPELVGRAVSDMDVAVRFDAASFVNFTRPVFRAAERGL
jgi:hypothetical protein